LVAQERLVTAAMIAVQTAEPVADARMIAILRTIVEPTARLS